MARNESNHQFNLLLDEVKDLKRNFKRLNYKANVLYDVQWNEKVGQGYEKWRFDSNGGLKLVKEQLAKLDNKCPVCHTPLTEKIATVDHLRPKSKYLGDAVDTRNMLIMCHSCNSSKNNQEFKAWYLKLPPTWKERLGRAIKEVHGATKLVELLADIRS